MNEFTSFEDFFPFYVAEHSKAATRWMHFAGTHLGVALGTSGIARRRWGRLAAAPVVAYGMAWFSHFVIEGNKPATFGHAAWSFRGDWKMLGMMWTGRDAELARIADENKRERLQLAAQMNVSPEQALEPVAALP
ncbi:MAG TPA: DUF962 domain-containing protein [Candidatus Dormibacteraeota bacterium]|nr:DUF962 domain-containing protein [Candidatus Dormibacteraeota bacterium]